MTKSFAVQSLAHNESDCQVKMPIDTNKSFAGVGRVGDASFPELQALLGVKAKRDPSSVVDK